LPGDLSGDELDDAPRLLRQLDLPLAQLDPDLPRGRPGAGPGGLLPARRVDRRGKLSDGHDQRRHPDRQSVQGVPGRAAAYSPVGSLLVAGLSAA
jgi:hypothetical protein